MRLAAILATPLVCTLYTSCDDGLADPPAAVDTGSDGIEFPEVELDSGDTGAIDPAQEESVGPSAGGHQDLNKQCNLASLVQCPVTAPGAWELCDLATLNECEYSICRHEKVAVQNILFHATCTNIVCPDFAVDLDRLRNCASDLSESSVACMKRTSCDLEECPEAFDSLSYQAALHDCLFQ